MQPIMTSFRECGTQIFHYRDRCPNPKMHMNPKNKVEQAAVFEKAKVANDAIKTLLYRMPK